MIRNYQDLTRLEMEQLDRKHTIVLIPLGALEQHGNQAPLGTDDIIANAMVSYLKEELEAVCEDFPMLVFPVIPVGLSTEHKNFCGSVTFRPDTYYHLLYDINAPLVQILSRELRSDLGLYAFYLSSGAFSHPDVKATVSPGNIWDFHGGEMETSMVMAVDPSLVKLDTAQAGIPAPFLHTRALKPYGGASISWMSEDWKTEDGTPIGIGGDPSGATAEKGSIILRTSARELVPGLLDISDWDVDEEADEQNS